MIRRGKAKQVMTIFEYKIESLKFIENKKDQYSKTNTIKSINRTSNYWDIYLNNIKEDINTIVNKGRVVNINDNIELKEQLINI